MAWGKGGAQGSVSSWTAADLAAVYAAESNALTRRAYRYLRDDHQAQEIVQEAFIKVMLAAPELTDIEHLKAYLNKTVTNLSLNLRRSQGRGPLLVAVDSDTSEAALNELAAETHIELDDSLTRADDAAIIREALSRLSEADRAILVAREVEQKTTEQIAAEYGVKEASVRNALYRARRNFRTILETWVVDEKTGMTAAQMLSSSYAKIAENSKKIGGAALSLVLLVAAFFGFWNNPTQAPTTIAAPTVSEPTPTDETPATIDPTTPSATPTATGSAIPLSPEQEDALIEQSTQAIVEVLATMGTLSWPGFDAAGLPVGFTVNNGGNTAGEAVLTNQSIRFRGDGAIIAGSEFITVKDGINVLLQQSTTLLNGKMTYTALPLVRVNGTWTELEFTNKSIKVTRNSDGTWVITAYYIVDVQASEASLPAAGMGMGQDASKVPAVIATRLHVTANGQPIIGQAVQVLAPLAQQ